MKYIENYNSFLESFNWEEFNVGDDAIKVVRPNGKNYVVKLTDSVDSANTCKLIADNKNNFTANILRVDKVKGKKLYFIVEEFVKPISDSEIQKHTSEIVKLIKQKTDKMPKAFEQSKEGLLDILFWAFEENLAIEHELSYSYSPAFLFLLKSLKLKDFDLNSHNMATRKGKYILFDVTGSAKKQKIDEIVCQNLNDVDKLMEWYILNIIKG